MNNIRAALRRLTEEPANLRRDPIGLPASADTACAELVACLAELRQRVLNVAVPQPPLNPAKVWKYWQDRGFDLDSLNGLEIRTLCTSEETALRPELVEALEERPDVLRRSICLFGVAVTYFSQWRTMTSPERVERLIRGSLSNNERPGSVASVWRQRTKLFSSEAAEYLANQVVAERSGIVAALEPSLVPLTSRLALATAARVAELGATNFIGTERSLTEEQKMRELKWFTESAWLTPVPTASFHAAASQIILSRSAEQSELFRKALIQYIRFDGRLGDPRLGPSNAKWKGMEPAAAQRFLAWLARDSIQFFFNTILPDTNDNRRRKDFWLSYYGAIRDFQVAVSEEDLLTLRRSISSRELPLFSKVNHPTTSAFLMRFARPAGDIVVVEFSETGNAAYLYESRSFESTNVTFRTPQFDVQRHLKHAAKFDRIIHNGNWEWPARSALARLGIRP